MLRRGKENIITKPSWREKLFEHSTSVAGHATVCPFHLAFWEIKGEDRKTHRDAHNSNRSIIQEREERCCFDELREFINTKMYLNGQCTLANRLYVSLPKKIQLPSHSVFLCCSDVSDYLEIFTAQKSPVQFMKASVLQITYFYYRIFHPQCCNSYLSLYKWTF